MAVCAGAVVAALAVLPSYAGASALEYDGRNFTYQADPAGDGKVGEANQVSLVATFEEEKLLAWPGPVACVPTGFGSICAPPERWYRNTATFRDTGDAISFSGGGCCGQSISGELSCLEPSRNPHQVRCESLRANWGASLDADLGAGNDEATVSGASSRLDGGAGDDTLVGSIHVDYLNGGPGRDTMTGAAGEDVLYGDCWHPSEACGDGNDEIWAADGERDAVFCGGGTDIVHADPADEVHGCEDVRISAGG